jgi:DNA-binding XRE family transcriptional regulator
MTSEIQMLQIAGKPYVLMPRAEYDRLTLLAKAESLPPLPAPDARGTVPAVDYARASIARKILTRRAELGLSQRDLAKLAGVRVESLCRIETGKVTPTVATIERIDRALTKAETPPKSRRRSR